MQGIFRGHNTIRDERLVIGDRKGTNIEALFF